MGAYSRNKGVRVERAIVEAMADLYPAVGRNWSAQDERKCGRDLKHTPGLCIQVKGGKKNPPWKGGLREAIEETHRTRTKDHPVVVTKEDGKKPVVHMLLKDFLKVLEAAQAGDPDTYRHSSLSPNPT